MKVARCLGVLPTAISYLACASASYEPPLPKNQKAPELITQLAAPSKDLLQDLVTLAAASRVFVLDEVDTGTGIAILRLNPGHAADFVDCGQFYRPWIVLKYRSFTGSYGDFLLSQVDSGLRIRVVAVLTPISAERTLARVSGDFELQSRQESSFFWTRGRLITWKFTTDVPRTNQLLRPAWGSRPERTCLSNMKAESIVMHTLEKLAEGF
jgi:hypothetical protein